MTTHRTDLRLTTRRGMLVLEACVSAAMLAVLLVVVNRIVVSLHRQTAAADRQFVAQQVLDNAMEEVTTGDWDKLSGGALPEFEVSAWAQKKLPGVTLRGEVTEETEPVAARRITLQLTWRDAADRPRRPLTLTTWVYPTAGSVE